MKEAILQEAKQLFAKCGYRKTRLSDLAIKMKLSRGNITYYFPSKDSIVECLFQLYSDKIANWIDLAELPINGPFDRRLYYLIIHDSNTLQFEDSRNFYRELISTPVLNAIMLKSMKSNVQLLIDAERTKLSVTELVYFTEGLVGAHQAMDMLYITGLNPASPSPSSASSDPFRSRSTENSGQSVSVFEHIRLKQQIRIRSLRLNNYHEINKTLDAAIQLLQTRDYSHIRLL
jgi:AcrR family transcriptional regulator